LFPLAALFMLVGGVGVMASLPSMPPARWRQAAVALLAPLPVPAAILLCGVLLSHRENGWVVPAPRWPEYLVTGLLAAHLPLAAVLVWRLREARALALFALLAVAGYSCGAAIMSTMSVSGKWL